MQKEELKLISRSDLTLELRQRAYANIDRSGGPDACHLDTRLARSPATLYIRKSIFQLSRIIYMMEYGRFPNGSVVRSCGNKRCYNSNHMKVEKLVGMRTRNVQTTEPVSEVSQGPPISAMSEVEVETIVRRILEEERKKNIGTPKRGFLRSIL